MSKKAKRPMSTADAKFLTVLGHELRTQPTDGNCDPRFWTVIDEKKDVPCWSENAEEWALIDDEGNVVGHVPYETDAGELLCVPVRSEVFVPEDILFLTKREAQEHIERNRHHYNKPYTYVQTAWRSPQYERLLGLLAEVDWATVALLLDDRGALTCEMDVREQSVVRISAAEIVYTWRCRCTACGWEDRSDILPNFCPSCGAKVVGLRW